MPAEEPGFQALSTKRLILRKPELNDAREIFNLRSNEQVNQYLDRHPATDLEDATDFLNKIIQSIDGGEGSRPTDRLLKLVTSFCPSTNTRGSCRKRCPSSFTIAFTH